MFRIDGPGATNDNKFTEGDPASGARATVVTAEWLNAIQEELATVVEQSGLSLEKSDSDQLLSALKNSSKFSNIGSVAEGFSGRQVVQDLIVFAPSWHAGGRIGGGVFVGMANIAKSSHDGGLFVSPTVPAVSEQAGADDNEKLGNFNDGVGESEPEGNGVFVRIDPIFSPRAYGARYDGSDDTSAIASYDSLVEPKGADLINYSAQESVGDAIGGPGFSPSLAEDCDAIAGSGTFYTDASTLRRPLGESGNLIQIEVDANTATQQYITFSTNQSLFRAKTAGTWATWQLISSQEIFSIGWPTINGDNVISEISTGTTSGWNVQSGSLITDGANLTFSNNGTPVRANRSVVGPTSGDYLIYMTLRAESVAGSYVNVNLGGVGAGKVTVSLGYNWVAEAGEVNRVSCRFNTNSVSGPSIDYSVQDVEIAMLYNAEFGSGTLYIKDSGEWVAYGVVDFPDPYAATIGVTQGGDENADLIMKEWFVAKPNVISIGDSVTEGATLYSPNPSDGLDNYSSTWMAYARLYDSVRNSVIVNKGIGSQTSADIAARIGATMTDCEAQVVFLSACNNDFGSSISLAQRTANIQSSIDTIVAAGAKVALYNAVYPSSDNATYPANGDYYRNWWETESQNIENANIKIDWMAAPGILDGDYMDAVYTQPDGVHPNPAGYEILGNYIESLEG